MRVLLILPESDLNTEHEMQWIGRTFHTETLRDVTVASLFEYVNGRQFDVLHFGAHGSDDGIQLSHNSILDMVDLARIARAVGARLVYLNSCSSARLAQYLVDQDVPAVIATTANVSDRVAWSTAILFYQAMQTSDDFYTAFDLVKPRDGTLSFFSDGKMLSRHVRPIIQRMDIFETAVLDLRAEMARNDRRLSFSILAMLAAWMASVGYSMIRF